jgi:hypothetical protein
LGTIKQTGNYTIVDYYGTSSENPYDEKKLKTMYKRHNEAVLKYFENRSEDLLVLNVAEKGSYLNKWKFFYDHTINTYYRVRSTSLWRKATVSQLKSLVKFLLKHNLNDRKLWLNMLRRYRHLTTTERSEVIQVLDSHGLKKKKKLSTN